MTDFEPSPGPARTAFRFLEDSAGAANAIDTSEQDTAAILYTSGTTGNPKGVMLTHRNFLTNCEAAIERMELLHSDVGLCILPMFHSFAWTGNVVVSLRLRCKLVVAPAIAPAEAWLTLMGKHGVSLFTAVPQVYSLLAKEVCGVKGLVLKYWFFRKVRLAISGAAPLSPAVQQAFERAMGVPIIEGYGLTETTPVATLSAREARKPGSVGRAINGVRIKIVDDTEDHPSARGRSACGRRRDEGVLRPAQPRAAFTSDAG